MTVVGDVFAAAAIVALGYLIAAHIIRFADKAMPGAWAAWNDDPRPAQLLNSHLVGEEMVAAARETGGKGALRATATNRNMIALHVGGER